jgi:hypothetical protein
MSSDATPATEVVYPESDGKPMADNMVQFNWMEKIVGELQLLFDGQNVFVAGNLFWYPVEGQPTVVLAPDAMVVFGRPQYDRGSYRQWEEENLPPQVVFEILSPNNTTDELDEKYRFYDRHGVEEYYFLNPYRNRVEGYRRAEGRFIPIWVMDGHVSPRLGIRFQVNGVLELFTPDGRVFETRRQREARLSGTTVELEKTSAAFEDERRRANELEAREMALAAKLRELGVDPDAVLRPAG